MRYNSARFVAWLDSRMKSKGWGKRETATHAGVSHPLIIDAMQGVQPSERTCVLLAILFEESVESVLQMAGHLKARAIDGSPVKKTLAIQVDGLSDDEAKKASDYVRYIKETTEEVKKS